MVNVPIEKTLLTLDDLLNMGDVRVEIIDGELVEMVAAGGIHHIIVSNIFRILDSFVVLMEIGAVFPDGLTYLMFEPPSRLKHSYVPDVSFIRLKNIPSDWDVNKPHPGIPDLAVEVVSPGDSAEDVQRKLRTYLAKGTEQVWLVYPKTKEVHQFINGDPERANVYKGSATIDTENLFPGIQGLITEAIFHLPVWAIKDE